MKTNQPYRNHWKRLAAYTLLLVATLSLSSATAADPPAAALFDETACRTLFAFDQASIPSSQNLRLEMRQPTKHPGNPVVARGKAGEADAWGVQFYGSVIREQGKFRLWYVAVDDELESKTPYARWRAAYAESDDGMKWTKPNLGLVEFRGNKNNNLILTEPGPLGFVNLKVLADPEDPNPERRYKISTHVYFQHKSRLGTLAPYASADGLTWKLLTDAQPTKTAELLEKDLVLPAVHFEPCGGLYKWDGMYYVCGQNAMNATRPYHGRVTRMYRSPDFVHWSPTSSLGFVRTAQHTLLGPGRSLEGEQNHEGISVWNRRNVLLGIYGRWHGAKEWKYITIDLGFVVSSDGLTFCEPAHEWTFLPRGEDGAWDQGGLLQGQGFENIGDQTLIYYGAWDPRHGSSPRGGVGIATLPRDRFGDLVVETAGQGPGAYQQPAVTSEFVTAPIPLKSNTSHRFYVNADGLGPAAALKIELLGDNEKPLPGYSGADAAVIRTSGFQTPIPWRGKHELSGLPEKARLRVAFEGDRKSNIRFSAIYVQNGP
jgi:hypothetical protein